jgi:hypothetical protein
MLVLLVVIFASGFTTSTLDGFDISYSVFSGSFDFVSLLINVIIFSVLFYPFSRFFVWLYSATPKNLH